MSWRTVWRGQSPGGVARTACEDGAALPVCDGASFTTVIERPRVPVHQNLVLDSEREALEIPRGDLTMVACQTCGFVFNRTFDAGKLLYGAQYDNTQLASSVFQDHVNRLVRHIVDERGIRNAQIVEVGCGKGAFLRALVTDEGANDRGIGFDPSYVGPDQELGGRLALRAAILRRDVHRRPGRRRGVPPRDGARSGAAGASPGDLRGARAAPWRAAVPGDAVRGLQLLKNDVVWDFFYEHCSLFTAAR